jgi:alkylation response protein AidB-like acyl-CoA dehydrogenase
MFAPGTALALNMHNYWVGDAADLWRTWRQVVSVGSRRGRPAGRGVCRGTCEHGNDIPGLLSTTKAEKVAGGYKFTGRKAFGRLDARLGRARNARDGHERSRRDPRIVQAFMPRDSKGYSIQGNLGTLLGMRATRSDDTVLDGAFVPDKYIAGVVPAARGR